MIKKGIKHKIQIRKFRTKNILDMNEDHVKIFKSDEADLIYFKVLFMLNFKERDYHQIIY